jgi:hypothetical protein
MIRWHGMRTGGVLAAGLILGAREIRILENCNRSGNLSIVGSCEIGANECSEGKQRLQCKNPVS